MKFTRAGIILFTQNYEECVAFYGSVLELEVLHEIDREDERLTTFSLGNAYLMIETGGVASEGAKTVAQNPTKFRFNVSDVSATCELLRRKGVDVSLATYTWGTIAEFTDPDGNLCALRSDDGFGE